MKQRRKDLQPFDMACLNEIRKLRGEMKKDGEANSDFWEELEAILKSDGYTKNDEWERLEGDIILGEVWRQTIGDFFYKNNVHHFTWMYVATEGLVVDEHGHEECIANGTQVRKVKEWYIFPDGRMTLCKKGCTHKLVNNYGKPIYVLSLKIGSKGMA